VRSLTAVLTAALVLLPATPAWAANGAPVVVDDVADFRNQALPGQVKALDNDSDPDGDPLVFTAVTPPTKGTAYIYTNGLLYYQPYFGGTGTDSFTYTVSDGQGNTATGMVTITLWSDLPAPGSLTISSAALDSATVSWPAATNATKYQVFLGARLVGTTADLTWTDTGLLPHLQYGYRIASVNGGGFGGSQSTAVVYRQPQKQTPVGLAAAVTDDPTTLSLTWTSAESGPWNVYRDGALVGSSPTRSFTDTGLVTGQPYSYQVQTPGSSSATSVTPSSALSAAVTATPVVLTDIDRFFRDHPGSLGPVTVPERAIAGGRQQDHQNGVIVQQDGETPWAVTGTLAGAYLGLDGATGDLGFPVAAQESGLRNGGIGQFFENGSIWDSNATPPVIVPWFVQDGWATTGWEEGPLGYPIGDLFEPDGGFAQDFEGGAVYWSEDTGSHGVASPIFDHWATAGYERGALGYPTADEVESVKGLRQSFTGGTIWWSPSVGAQVVSTTLQSAWARSGWENGPLGEPSGAEGTLPGGRYQRFQGGYVYWSAATGAQAVVGAIRTVWGRSGSEKGPLGYPTSDEIALPDGARYQKFQGGYVFWTATTGAWPVYGAFRTTWGRNGSQSGPLGYPLSDQTALAGGGRYQKFQGGYVFWTASTGAWPIYGGFRTAWGRNGSQTGPLGYPLSDQTALAGGGQYQKFQGGYVFWTASTGAWPIYGAFRTIWGSTGSQTGRLGYPTSDQTLSGGKRRQSFQRGTITVEVATGRSTITYR
jgi:uncharacterized protein with LGFP repeats